MTTQLSATPAGRSIPSDMPGLTATYGAMLTEMLQGSGLKGKTIEHLAEELEGRGFLRSFDFQEYLPPLLSSEQVLGLLGASWCQWTHWHYNASKNIARHAQYLPKPIIGRPYSRASEYAAKDILRVLRSPKRFSDTAPVYPEETVKAHEEFIRAAAERVLYDWAKKPAKSKSKKMSTESTEKTVPVQAKKPAAEMAFVGWPDGVPKDYNALVRDYRPFVERCLNRYVKPCPSQSVEDVKQHIWMKLIESDTLGKFVEKARFRKIPAKATAAEAVEYLGITWDQWMDLMRKDLKWLQPLDGAVFSNTAVFTREQIRNVEDSGLFPIQDAIPAGDMSKVFRGYLRNVIHNHFANYCRTRVRRFIKDTVVPSENSRVNGGKLGSALDGDLTSWEDALEDADGMSPDSCVDLPECSSLEELNDDLSEQLGLIAKVIPSARQDEVFNHIADGCTLREAIYRVKSQLQTEKLRVQVG